MGLETKYKYIDGFRDETRPSFFIFRILCKYFWTAVNLDKSEN